MEKGLHKYQIEYLPDTAGTRVATGNAWKTIELHVTLCVKQKRAR